jgi:hypothetical protein
LSPSTSSLSFASRCVRPSSLAPDVDTAAEVVAAEELADALLVDAELADELAIVGLAEVSTWWHSGQVQCGFLWMH